MTTATAPTPGERAPHHTYYGRPVYRCRVCAQRYERVDNLAAVLRHEAEAHPEPPPPPVLVRESPILGPDGKPVLVATTGAEGHESLEG